MSIAREIQAVAALAQVQLSEVKHVLLGAERVQSPFQIGPTLLLTYQVPQQRCLLITRIDLWSMPIEVESGNAIFSERQRYSYNGHRLFWKTGSGATAEFQTAADNLSIQMTGDVFYLFPADRRLQLFMQRSLLITLPLAVSFDVRASGFLLPSHTFSSLQAHSTENK